VILTEEQYLKHYGTPRHSGRYPWGSGGSENVSNKRNKALLDDVSNLRKHGMSESDIAKGMGMTTTQLRARKSIALAQQRQDKQLRAQRLKEHGLSNVEIGKRMGGLNESSVRALLAPGAKDKADALRTTADMLKSQVDKKKYIQVGSGVEQQLGVTRTRLNTAIAMLKESGYQEHTIFVPQIATGKYTSMKVLSKPGTTLAEVNRNRSQIRLIDEHSEDRGRSFLGFQPPISISSRRIGVNYGPEGAKADGVIYVRPGVKELSIGSSRYGQVRIAVDGTHYLKGMAVYKDDLPPGVDLMFNTNKTNTGRKKDVMKEMESDPELPFGSIVRQLHGPDGKVSSAMNMIGSPTKEGSGEEGSWDTYSKTLSSQILSKQSPELAKKQLSETHKQLLSEFDNINSLTNPTVRKELLLKFADETDSSAVHLKAASLPRQATKVILPIPSMKPNEIYAPTFRDGERVALIRFPHAGTFEIPQLTVNNRNREARKMLGTGDKGRHDAVGIHHKVAEHLSGADFDGDFVLVIPNSRGSIKSTPALEGLKHFDPMVYKLPKDSPIPHIGSVRKQQEMGKISNLITDMTLRGASTEQLSRAVRHSMVVIDSEKHGLDFKQSEKDHGIAALKEEYQGGKKAGATTLISRAKAKVFINQRRPRPAGQGGPIDLVTGRKVFVDTGRMIPDRATGALKPKQEKSKRLAETHDAFSLSSGTAMESLYAEHSNTLKALANRVRKETLHIKSTPYSPSAKAVYAKEVASLTANLNIAEKNAPREKQAQLLANAHVAQRRQANPHMDPAELKKIKTLALNEARIRTGAKRHKVPISQTEWDAIQAGAITTDKLNRILKNTDIETVKKLAMPRHTPKMTNTMKSRAKQMLDSGATQAQVADALGVGLTTLKLSLNE
jgi:hypothetical protein